MTKLLSAAFAAMAVVAVLPAPVQATAFTYTLLNVLGARKGQTTAVAIKLLAGVLGLLYNTPRR